MSPCGRTLRAPRPRFAAAALIALVVAVLGCGGGDGTRRSPGHTLVYGVDGADWDRALPLMRQGKLPVFARLCRTGARRTLTSLAPPPGGPEWLSPSIWTSVATGVVPERHGILNFVAPSPDGRLQPVTSNQRRTASLWNILTARGMSVGVVGWLVTWPAERVQGYVVSSYTPFVLNAGPDPANRPLKGTLVPGVPHQVWPRELQTDLERLKVTPSSIPDSAIAEQFTGEALPAEPGEDAAKSVDGLRWSWAADRTYERAYRELAERPPGGRRPDLEMLYFGSVDVVSHRFWKYGEPATFAFGEVDRGEVAAYGPAVESSYRTMDETLGRVLAVAADSLRLLVVSDHGFRENRDPQRNSSGWHRPEGLLIANGPGIRADALLDRGSAIDVAPTVLYSLGLPVADDFDGSPELDLFTEAFRRAHPVESIASWEQEASRARDDAPVASPVDAEILERLRSLGYLD
jgi:predicted AlkP superfamily phosphohydrolase/phosphomutase